MINTKVCTWKEKKLDKGINSGHYRIYQKKEKNNNYILIELLDEMGVTLRKNYHDITETLTNVKRIQILEYSAQTDIRFYNKDGVRLTDYSFEYYELEDRLKERNKINFLRIDYSYILGKLYLDLCIDSIEMKKYKFLDRMYTHAPVSRLLVTDNFDNLYRQKKISISISDKDDCTETRIYNLQELDFKVLGKTFGNVDNMRIKERGDFIKVMLYDKKVELLKLVITSNIIKNGTRLLCLKTGVFNNSVQFVESDDIFVSGTRFLDGTTELSKRLLPLEE